MKSEVEKRLETLTLEQGQTKIIGMNNTKAKDQVQLVYAQFIDRNDNVEEDQDPDDFEIDLLSMHMKDHEAFKNRARLCWGNATLAHIKENFDAEVYAKAQELAADDSGNKLFEELDILNPTIEHPKYGTVYEKIKLIENHKPQGNDIKYLDKALKQNGEGEYLFVQEKFVDPDGVLKEGRKLGIFMHLRIAGVPEDPKVKGQGREPKHVLIPNELTGRTKVMDEIEYLELGEDFDPKALKAYRSQKDLTAPQGDQEAPKEKEPEQV